MCVSADDDDDDDRCHAGKSGANQSSDIDVASFSSRLFYGRHVQEAIEALLVLVQSSKRSVSFDLIFQCHERCREWQREFLAHVESY